MTFKPNKMKHYPPQIIFLQRRECVDLMQEAEYFHDTTFQTQQPKHIFLAL